jgi:hypothetical protein
VKVPAVVLEIRCEVLRVIAIPINR